MSKKLFLLASLLIVASMVLGACATAAPKTTAPAPAAPVTDVSAQASELAAAISLQVGVDVSSYTTWDDSGKPSCEISGIPNTTENQEVFETGGFLSPYKGWHYNYNISPPSGWNSWVELHGSTCSN